MTKQKNDRFIVNKEILPKTKRGSVDWNKVNEVEVYFTDTEESYILKVEDIKKENRNTKILLSYNEIPYNKYLQVGQVLNGNFENVFRCFGVRVDKLRPFRLSDDGTYWIGITEKDKEFYFNGEYSEEIMKHNWHVGNGYVVCIRFIKEGFTTTVRLNRFVLGVTDKNIIVNHCGGNKMDNRVEVLSLSDHEDNAKELLPSILNNTGITGLTLNKKTNKYNISCNVKGFSYTCLYKTKDEALKDLLIIQRYYGYRHNENLYYMLDNISEEYSNQLIKKVEDKINKRKVNPIICKNRFELSDDKTFYYMYDKDSNKCKISIDDLELVKQGNWSYALNNGKEYFSGGIIVNGKRKNMFLHRFLFDLTDPKYRIWYIDHLDGDGLNNTRENMVITDAEGNGFNQKGKNILENKKYRVRIRSKNLKIEKRFKTWSEAENFRNKVVLEQMKNRIQFNSKKDLDEYLINKNI